MKLSLSRSYISIFLVAVVLCAYGLAIPVASVKVRPEKVLVLLCLPMLAGYFAVRGGLLATARATLPLVCWIVLGLGLSVFSVDPQSMIRHWLDLTLSVAVFFLVYVWFPRDLALKRPNHLLLVGLLLGMSGTLIALFHWSGGDIENNLLSSFAYIERGVIRIKMTLWESNIYGAVMALFCLLSIAEKRKGKIIDWIIVFFCHAGLILSYSRGPIGAYFFSLIIYYMLIGKKQAWRLLMIILLVGVSLSAYKLARIASGMEQEGSFMRFKTLTPRIVVAERAFQTIKENPLLGSGIYSAESLYPGLAVEYGGRESEPIWISTLPVAILHDTGIPGFLLFFGFLYVIFRNACKKISWHRAKGSSPQMIKRMAAWLGAGTILLVVSLVTTLHPLGLFWAVMAIVAKVPAVDDC